MTVADCVEVAQQYERLSLLRKASSMVQNWTDEQYLPTEKMGVDGQMLSVIIKRAHLFAALGDERQEIADWLDARGITEK
jgi:hypothetical protein